MEKYAKSWANACKAAEEHGTRDGEILAGIEHTDFPWGRKIYISGEEEENYVVFLTKMTGNGLKLYTYHVPKYLFEEE